MQIGLPTNDYYDAIYFTQYTQEEEQIHQKSFFQQALLECLDLEDKDSKNLWDLHLKKIEADTVLSQFFKDILQIQKQAENSNRSIFEFKSSLRAKLSQLA